MMLVDTHCHLDFPEFNQDRDDVIDRAKKAGISYIINIGSSIDGSKKSVELAKKDPIVYASIGIHPHYAKDVNGKIPGELKHLVKKDKVVAIGETGLDYYRDLSPKEVQKNLFIEFINFAKENNLPLIIHTRRAHEDVLIILKNEFKDRIKGVMHCFSADEEYLKRCLKLGLYISFTCNLTFKNAKNLRTIAKEVPPERLLLETDSPFMAPQEFRGKRNEPAYLISLVSVFSQIYGLSEDDIARITTHNARTLFKLPIEEKAKIAYPIRNSLYLNITNRCTNECDFCVRYFGDFVKGHNLKLDHDPDIREIIEAMGDPTGYKEVVFCGYGEPTLRLDVVKKIAKRLKGMGVCVRMVTNGEGNLVHNRSIVKELHGLIDRVSVSLNVDTEEKYDKICRSKFGPGVFKKVKEFTRECKDAGMEVEVTFLDMPDVDKKICERIAKDELKVNFRIRRLNVVG